MENETNKGGDFEEKDVLKDLGENLSEFSQKIGKKFSEFMDDFSSMKDGGESGEIRTKVDVFENKTHYVIEMELPGVDKKQVKIAITDDVLTIKGQKENEENSNREFFIRERRFGTFIRNFELPNDIEKENIKAKFNNGILLIEFPKLNVVAEPEDDGEEINID